MISKEYITELKYKGNGEIASLINTQNDVSSINYILESLGHLPTNFNADFLYNLLNHNHAQVRLNAVKNIGKLNGNSNIRLLYELYLIETDTSVRREIVSSIGRQRHSSNKQLLFTFLTDDDPKIVCQAIRGLLVFENDKEVEEHLQPLINHPNEMVRSVIYKQFYSEKKTNKDTLPHTETYEFLKNVVVNADVMEALKYVPDESVHLTFTSTPHNKRVKVA
jgi:hypothetical protein